MSYMDEISSLEKDFKKIKQDRDDFRDAYNDLKSSLLQFQELVKRQDETIAELKIAWNESEKRADKYKSYVKALTELG